MQMLEEDKIVVVYGYSVYFLQNLYILLPCYISNKKKANPVCGGDSLEKKILESKYEHIDNRTFWVAFFQCFSFYNYILLFFNQSIH